MTTPLTRRLALLFVCLCNLFSISFGQVSVFLPSQSVESGTDFSLPIKVDSFNRIVTIQFTLEWDPSLFEFVEVNNFGLTLNLTDNFQINKEEGEMAFLWFDKSPDAQGVDLADSTSIFALQFNAVGNAGVSSSVDFTNKIAIQEVADTSFSPIRTTFINGQIDLIDGNPTSIATSHNTPPFVIKTAYPNPTPDFITFDIVARRPAQGAMNIYQPNGTNILKRSINITEGLQSITLTNEDLPVAGVYLIEVVTSQFSVIQKIIRQ